MKLNDRQKEAVENGNGRCLVIAGAGAGKTRVLTERIKFLVDSGVSPESILAITFTNKAADEMKERICSSVGPKTELIWIGTFHSVCARILRMFGDRIGIRSNFTIADDQDSFDIVKSLIKERLAFQYSDDGVRAALSTIAYCVNTNIIPDDRSPYKAIYELYHEKLRGANVIDFNGLIMYAVELLTKHNVIQFKHVLVDEFQDTNIMQMMLVKLLSQAHGNLFAVCDDFQAIYSWRYATIENVLDLNKDTGTKKYVLDQNYRSTGTILDAANSVIQKNKKQIPKELWTENPVGEPIGLVHVFDNYAEAQAICKLARRYEGQDLAVLCRTNSQMRDIETEMIRSGIPYRIFNGPSIFSYKIVKVLMSYLKFIENHEDVFSLRRILNFPKRGIGDKTMLKILEYIDTKKISPIEALSVNLEDIGLSKKITEEISGFVKVIRACRELSDNIVDVVNLLTKHVKFTSEGDDAEIFFDFITIVEKISKSAERVSLYNFLEMCSLSYDDSPKASGNVTKLMTIHGAKGLEFDIVIIPGVEEGVIPHSGSLNNASSVEEERRLFYVALTRAKKKAILSLCVQRNPYAGCVIDCYASRFLKEIPRNLIQRMYV